MRGFFYLCFVIAQLWVVAAVARALLSWFPIRYGSVTHKINTVLVRVTEPLIAPVRRLVPGASVGGVGIDVSFTIVILVVQLVVVPFFARRAFF